MFPLRDSVPSSRAPVVNILIIAACVLVFLFELMLGPALDRFLFTYAFVPARLFEPTLYDASLAFNLKSVMLSMFLHGGWLHLIGNMWFLWIFGDNVEDALGHAWYLVFYIACGLVASFGQAIVAPSSRVPMIGASGAIAGVLGAYLVWYPWSRVRTLLFLGFFFTFTEMPAPVFLVLWFVIQFFSGTLSLVTASATSGGVAFFAHIGGFAVGLLVALWLRASGKVRLRTSRPLRWE
jgi:rhomboid family protein